MLLNKHVYLVISILKLSKLVTLMYEFWYDYIKIKYREQQDCVLWIQFHCIHKNIIFTKTLQKMLKLDLTTQIMNQIDHYQKGKREKSNWINER